MSTPKGKCAGCKTNITSKQFLCCSLCLSKYDLQCANMNEKIYLLLDKDRKAAWKCQACKNQQPKGNPPFADITNDESSEPNNQNVTVRSKPTSSKNSNNLDCTMEGPLPATIEEISELLDRKLSSSSSIICNLRLALKEDLLSIITAKLQAATEQLKADFTTTTDFLSAEQRDLTSQLKQKDKEIKELQNKSSELQIELQALNNRITTIEKISRENNLEIQGVKEQKSENLLQLFKTICETVKASMADSDVKSCRRIAKMDPTSDRPRSILVTLSSPRLREDILRAVSRFNKTSNGKLNSRHLGMEGATENVYVSEHLSPDCKKLFKEARKIGRDKGYKFVWVRRGFVYVRKDEGMPPTLIKSNECLRKLK